MFSWGLIPLRSGMRPLVPCHPHEVEKSVAVQHASFEQNAFLRNGQIQTLLVVLY